MGGKKGKPKKRWGKAGKETDFQRKKNPGTGDEQMKVGSWF